MTQIIDSIKYDLVRLGDICTYKYGFTAKSHSEKVGVPYLRITDIKKDGTLKEEKVYVIINEDDFNRYRLEKNDIVIARSGATVGKSFLFNINEDYVFASYLIRFRPDTKRIIPKFLFYLLNSSSYWNYINIHQTIGAQPNVNAQKLSNFTFQLPDKSTQEQIVKKIDTILSQIEPRKNSIITHIENSIEKIKFLISNLGIYVIQYYIPFTNTPKNWKIKKLSDIATVGQGGTPSRAKPEFWNGNIPWIRSGELLNNRIFDSKEKITELGLKMSSAQLCTKGTIMMAMTGQGLTRGRTGFLEIDACANQSCAHIINNDENILNEFLWLFLQSRYWYIRSVQHGSGQPGINTSLIKQLEIPIPSKDEQRKIIKLIEEKQSHLPQIMKELQFTLDSYYQMKTSLEHISDSILDQSLSGKLLTN